MIKPTINIGPLTFHLYGLIIALSIFLGWLLAKKRAKHYKINEKIFDDPILVTPLVLSIAGARIYHIVDYWSVYSQNLVSTLYIWQGGLGIWGALTGAFLGFFLVARLRKIDVLQAFDLVSPSLLLGQVLGRIGNYINQEGFGPPTEKPWGVFIEKEFRPAQFIDATHFHPTFFYEAILNLVFFVVLIYIEKRSKNGQMSIVKGQLFAIYLILYSTGRFIAEFWRIDTATIGVIKVAHVISAASIFLGVWLYVKFSKANRERLTI